MTKRKVYHLGGKRKRRVRRGGNIFQDVANWVGTAANKVTGNLAGKAGNYVHDNKVVSKLIKHVPVLGGVLSEAANMLGVGRKRRRRVVGGAKKRRKPVGGARKRRGKGIVSEILKKMPIVARKLGLGKKRGGGQSGGLSSLNGRLFLI